MELIQVQDELDRYQVHTERAIRAIKIEKQLSDFSALLCKISEDCKSFELFSSSLLEQLLILLSPLLRSELKIIDAFKDAHRYLLNDLGIAERDIDTLYEEDVLLAYIIKKRGKCFSIFVQDPTEVNPFHFSELSLMVA